MFMTLRARLMPALAAFMEEGVVGGEFGAGWLRFFAPAGTPKPVIDRVNKALITALEAPEIQSRIREMGLAYRPNGSPESMGRMVLSQRDT